MEVLIRHAEPADAGAVARLADQLGYAVTPGSVRGRLPAGEGQAVFVAEQAGAVVGWLHVAASVALQSAPYAEIMGLVTDAACRGQGVGRALLAEAEAWARQQGYASVRVRSNIVRDGAHRFYPSHGYQRTKTQHVYDKQLVETPKPSFGPVA